MSNNLIVAIPDLHGRDDLLEKVIDVVSTGPLKHARKVFLGDLVDKGPNTCEVVERIMSFVCEDRLAQVIMGNHEWMLTAAYLGFPALRLNDWLSWGGDATLNSYGVAPDVIDGSDRERLAGIIRDHIPEDHFRFLSTLPTYVKTANHTFVHAGINPNKRPGQGVEGQTWWDLMWIRDEFTNGDPDFGSHVVYGHTVWVEPFLREHSTGLDTGAYYTGALDVGIFDCRSKSGPVEILTITGPPGERKIGTRSGK